MSVGNRIYFVARNTAVDYSPHEKRNKQRITMEKAILAFIKYLMVLHTELRNKLISLPHEVPDYSA